MEEFFGAITIKHTYGWDGMQPTNPQVTIDRLDECQALFNEDYYGNFSAQFSQYAMMDIDHDGVPELLLQSEDESTRAAYSVALTISLLAGENGVRFLSFYKNAVCHSGSCGALCLSSVYVGRAIRTQAEVDEVGGGMTSRHRLWQGRRKSCTFAAQIVLK